MAAEYLDKAGLIRFKERCDEAYAPIELVETAVQYKGAVDSIEDLPELEDVQQGWMYNVATGGEGTEDFVEGEEAVVFDGANVVAVNTGTDLAPVMKWDLLPGSLDINDRVQFGTTMPVSPRTGQGFLYTGSTTYKYTKVTPEGTENPTDEGWYEFADPDYTLSDDTTIVDGTDYYTQEEEYVKGVIYVYDGTQWVGQTAGTTYSPIGEDFIDSLFE